jgi:hypothetical protein
MGKGTMTSRKKKVARPRRSWQINPVTRVKASARNYQRAKVKQRFRTQKDET